MDLNTGSEVVIKLAHPDVSDKMAKFLENEYKSYLQLNSEGNYSETICWNILISTNSKMIDVENLDPAVGKFGIPNVIHFGANDGYKFMVMGMLGSTLHDLKEITGKNKLLPKTIAKTALQMVNIH